MTFSTSAVAVCCCSASVRSSVRALHFVEQPRILDGDRGLIGESLNQFDLARREGFGLGTPEAENPDKLVFAHQGNHDDRAIAGQFGGPLVEIVGIVPRVGVMRDLARARRPARVQGVADRDRILAGLAFERFGHAELRDEPANVSIPQVKRRERRPTEFCRGFQNRRRRQTQIERRAADDLQDLGRRGLLLQRLGKIARARLHLVEQPRVLDGDDGLVGESLEQRDLRVGEGATTSTRRSTMTPIASASRIRGIARAVLHARPGTAPPSDGARPASADSLMATGYSSCAAARSCTCTGLRSKTARPGGQSRLIGRLPSIGRKRNRPVMRAISRSSRLAQQHDRVIGLPHEAAQRSPSAFPAPASSRRATRRSPAGCRSWRSAV